MSNKSIFSSVRWTVISSIIRKIFSFSLFFVLVRYLSKDDIGLFREFSLILSFGSVFFLGSLNHLLVISKDRFSSNLRVVLKLVTFSSIIGSALLFLLAPHLGRWYNSDVLTTIIRYTTGFLLLENFRRLLTSVLQRELKLKQLANAQTLNVIFYSVLTLIVVMFRQSVWVLILGFYSGNLLELLLLLWYSRNSLIACKKDVSITTNSFLTKNKKFLRIAWINDVVNNFSGNVPILVLGTIFPLAGMGVYYLANQVIIIPITVITTALLQVFFPAFSRKETHTVAQHFIEFSDFIVLVAFPLLALYTITACSYAPILFGAKWAETSNFMFLLSAAAAMSLLMNPVSGIPYSLQKPGVELVWSVSSTAIKVITVLLLSRFGYLISIAGFVIASIVSQITFIAIVLRLLNIDNRHYWNKFFLQLIPMIVISPTFILLYRWNSYIAPLVAFVVCTIYYIVLNYWIDYDIESVIKRILKPNREIHQQSS